MQHIHTSTPHIHVHPPTMVAINAHGTVSLVVGIGTCRPVDWDHLEVGAQTMAVSVIVGEQPTLWQDE